MANRELEASIRIGGDIDSSLRSAIDRAVDALSSLDHAALNAVDAASQLTDTLSDQRATLKAAQRQYAAYVLSGEESSQAAQELADSIRALSSDLNRNESRMREAQEAAQRLTREMDDADDSFDRAGDGIDDVGDAARDTEGGFTVMKGAISGLISNGISTLIGKCTEAVSSLFNLAEETREFRQDMATLETAYDQAGFSAETAGETWKNLYAIFGEDDRAVEAANNIARMADSQQDLDKWTKITTGIWGTYQDALPVESLAEAAGETAKVGTVTGTLADALNWNSDAAKMFADVMGGDVATAEDAFNVILGECTSEAERQAVITDTLIALYGDAADKYEETAGSIMDANKATADYTVATAEMGERIEPVTASVREGFARILNKILELTQGVDFQALAGQIQSGFSYVIDTVIPNLVNGFQWVLDNKDPILAAISGIAAAFAAWKIVGIVTTVIDKIKALGGVISAVKTGMATLNAILAANPIGIVITLVAGLVAAFVYLWNNCEGFRTFWINLGETIKSVAGAFGENVRAVFSGIRDAISGAFNSAREAIGSFFSWVGEKLSWLNDRIESIPVIGSLYSGAKNLIGGAADAISGWIFGGDEAKAYAKGGFTDGLSIAGEAGTEAIISFDPRYRSQNLSYWAKAGQMLGASDISLSEGSGGDSYNLGGVTFAPQITVTGMADKQSIMEAIRDEYPEFLDMLEEWFVERGRTTYA